MQSKKLVWRFIRAFNGLIDDPRNERRLIVCKAIVDKFLENGWARFWESLLYYISVKDHMLIAIPPLQDMPPNLFEVNGNTFRLVNEVVKRDKTLIGRKKILVELALKNQLTKRLLKLGA